MKWNELYGLQLQNEMKWNERWLIKVFHQETWNEVHEMYLFHERTKRVPPMSWMPWLFAETSPCSQSDPRKGHPGLGGEPESTNQIGNMWKSHEFISLRCCVRREHRKCGLLLLIPTWSEVVERLSKCCDILYFLKSCFTRPVRLLSLR
jgi:hypothetical protein